MREELKMQVEMDRRRRQRLRLKGIRRENQIHNPKKNRKLTKKQRLIQRKINLMRMREKVMLRMMKR